MKHTSRRDEYKAILVSKAMTDLHYHRFQYSNNPTNENLAAYSLALKTLDTLENQTY